MAKKQAVAVYRIVDVVGVSETSWEDAGRNAVETAAGSLVLYCIMVPSLRVQVFLSACARSAAPRSRVAAGGFLPTSTLAPRCRKGAVHLITRSP